MCVKSHDLYKVSTLIHLTPVCRMEAKKGSEKERVNQIANYQVLLAFSSERFVFGVQVESVDRRNDSREKTNRN